MGNITELAIFKPGSLLEYTIRLRIALDGVETSGWDWEVTRNKEGLLIHYAIQTVYELLEHSRLNIRIVEESTQHDADIDISGLGGAIATVRKHCGW